MVSRRREGGHVYYAISEPSVFELCDIVCAGIIEDLERRREAF